MRNAPGIPISSSQSNVQSKADSPAARGVTVVIQSSRYAGFPSFPFNPLSATQKKAMFLTSKK